MAGMQQVHLCCGGGRQRGRRCAFIQYISNPTKYRNLLMSTAHMEPLNTEYPSPILLGSDSGTLSRGRQSCAHATTSVRMPAPFIRNYVTVAHLQERVFLIDLSGYGAMPASKSHHVASEGFR